MMNIKIDRDLITLREHFVQKGFDIRFVGGCVRDCLLGIEPKDIDLCTDANPDEQRKIYEEYGIHHIATGLQHGTWTVVLNDIYEITSLRTETDHDGRHATVSWTKDWEGDLARRDLTCNAIAMTFEGDIIDPFGGKKDLENKVVRFVGNPEERIREDYLRILRFFRFHARIAGMAPYDNDAIQAVVVCYKGLKSISKERIWSEVSRIISGPYGSRVFLDMFKCFLLFEDIPYDWHDCRLFEHASKYTQDPVTLMAVLLRTTESVESLAEKWKWSNDEKKQALYIVKHFWMNETDAKKNIAVHRHNRFWVAEALRTNGMFNGIDHSAIANKIMDWDIPVFPVNGDDLILRGHKPGIEFRKTLDYMKDIWCKSEYTMNKEQLLESFEKQ